MAPPPKYINININEMGTKKKKKEGVFDLSPLEKSTSSMQKHVFFSCKKDKNNESVLYVFCYKKDI